MSIPNLGTNLSKGRTIMLNPNPTLDFKADCFNIVDKVISEVGRNKVLINIKDMRSGKRFVDSGPWNIKGKMMNLQR
ncbi:hypothetical protein AHAS_Ahas13G0256000 [Arachis hypogaea]